MQIVLRVKDRMHEVFFFEKCAGGQRITGRNKRQKGAEEKRQRRELKGAEGVKGEIRCMREKSNVKGKTEIQREIKGTRAKEDIEKVKGGNKKYR